MTRLSMPYEFWPAEDKRMWQTLLRSGEIFEEPGPFAKLRPSSVDGRRYIYGRWLAFLEGTEWKILEADPAARIKANSVRDWIATMTDHAPHTKLRCAEVILLIGRELLPDADWAPHKRIVTRLRYDARVTPSVRKRGRIVSSDVLYNAGMQLADTGTFGCPPPNLLDARKRRDGSLIAFLALMPMRRRALASLEIGKSFVLEGAQPRIVLQPTMTKTRTWWESEVPRLGVEILEDYVRQVHPFFLARNTHPHRHLWLNDSGHPYGAAHLGARIADLTKRLIGISVSAQLFRDCAATTLTLSSPEAARLTRAVLGHSNFRTAERHYIHARGIEAGRTYSDIVGELVGDSTMKMRTTKE